MYIEDSGQAISVGLLSTSMYRLFVLLQDFCCTGKPDFVES
jgi:hypothetical protein